jgi:predicted permease
MSRWLYRLALRAFPASHRAVYGDEMLETFAHALRERRPQTPRFILAACIDALRAGYGERRRTRPPRRQLLGSLGRDLGHAARSLAKARAFSLVSILSLGIGLGVVILMLVTLRALVGRPFGVVPDGLVELLIIPQGELRARVNDWAVDTWSYPDFVDINNATTGVTVTGWTPAQAVVRTPDTAPARVDAMYVSPNYFTTIGLPLARGAGFTQGTTADQLEVILSHSAWRNRFGGSPDVVGRTITIDGAPHVVVGLAPEHFRGHFIQHRPGFEVWLPLRQHPRLAAPDGPREKREVDWIHLLGRLEAGTSLSSASGAVAATMTTLAERYPASNALKSASVEPYFNMGARRRTDALAEALSLLAAATMVLIVVCLNMSGMVMVRTATRERELALRLAIGASRGRLVQYLLAEAVILAIAGGGLAAAVVFGTPALVAWWTGQPLEISFVPDAAMAALGIALSLVTSLVFGLLPAMRFSRPRILTALKDDTGGGGRRVGRIHRWTAAVQVGIAVPFLVIGGLQLEQFRATAHADLGFDQGGIHAVRVHLPAAKADADDGFVLRTLESRIEQAAGVSAVASANGLPLDTQGRITRVIRDGAPAPIRAHTTRISPRYLETMAIPVVRGRGITAEDRAGTDLVVVISQTLATRVFPDGDPLGQRLTFALEGTDAPVDPRWPHQSVPASAQTFTVVGVVADLVDAYLGPPQPQLFVSLAQHPATHVYVIARSPASPQSMTAAFQTALTGLYPEPDIIAANLVTGERLVRRARSEMVMWSAMSAISGGAALLLAALGIFGVVGFMVATRTREIGIRIALGAARSRVVAGVLKDATKLAAWGVAGGLALAFLWAREIAWTPLGLVETLTYTVAVAIALGVAVLAALPAARRAASVEPIIAMRAE